MARVSREKFNTADSHIKINVVTFFFIFQKCTPYNLYFK